MIPIAYLIAKVTAIIISIIIIGPELCSLKHFLVYNIMLSNCGSVQLIITVYKLQRQRRAPIKGLLSYRYMVAIDDDI